MQIRTSSSKSCFCLGQQQTFLPKLTLLVTFTNNMDAEQSLAFANRFFQAYNNVDSKTIAELVSEDVHFEHHGRFQGQGKGKLLEQVQNFSKMVPGRHYTEATRWAVNGNLIFIEHKAYGTPAVDVELFGWKEGEPVTMDCCTLLVLKNGKIVEWSDYA